VPSSLLIPPQHWQRPSMPAMSDAGAIWHGPQCCCRGRRWRSEVEKDKKWRLEYHARRKAALPVLDHLDIFGECHHTANRKRVGGASLAGNVADMSRHVGNDTTCRSNFGQMGPCCRHKI
jgi:hypothetical protein